MLTFLWLVPTMLNTQWWSSWALNSHLEIKPLQLNFTVSKPVQIYLHHKVNTDVCINLLPLGRTKDVSATILEDFKKLVRQRGLNDEAIIFNQDKGKSTTMPSHCELHKCSWIILTYGVSFSCQATVSRWQSQLFDFGILTHVLLQKLGLISVLFGMNKGLLCYSFPSKGYLFCQGLFCMTLIPRQSPSFCLSTLNYAFQNYWNTFIEKA